MQNDRDGKHNEHEESEYHFSDDDVSYEVETESSKPAAASGQPGLVKRLTGSKRMLISVGVFLLLVYVVYKMVAPGTQAPVTDIVPQATAPTEQTSQMVASEPTTAPAPVATPTPTAPPTPVTSAMPAALATQEVPTPQAPPVVANTQMQQQVPTMPGSTTTTTVTTATPAGAPTTPPPASMEQNPEVVVSMPAVIPVQSTVPSSPAPSSEIDVAIANMAATNEKLMSQLQSDYNQRFAESTGQTKALQNQIESLNARVVNMESQLNQLVQTLNRPAQLSPPPVSQIPAPPIPAPNIKVSYSVQAIIPGRAWLRHDNGETLTVAEGDTIKGLGRVTKIDPYDGIVEVNRGNRVVSISYGNTE